jgi:hypothetical protein
MKYHKKYILLLILLFFSTKVFASPTGMVLYGESDGLKYRIYDSQNGLGDEQAVPGITTPINFIRADACPNRSEVIVLALDNNGTLYCSTWTSVGGWAETPMIIRSGGDTTSRWFDVVYTKNGEAMIVYSDGTTALKYTIWNGYFWEDVRDVGNLYNNGKPPCWVTLAASKNQRNEVIMVYQNKDERWAFASVWVSSGAIRGFVSDYNTIILNGSVADSDAREGVTVAFETNSDEGVVFYNNNGLCAKVWDGISWSSAIISGASAPNHISAKPYPNGNNILLTYNIQGSGNTQAIMWNGDSNSFGSEVTLNPNGGTAGYYQIDADWELLSGHEGHYLIVSWVQSGGSYLQAGLLAKRWNGSSYVELYPVSGTGGITYNSVYLKTLTCIVGTASGSIQVLANTGATLNFWDFDVYTHQFGSKQELTTDLSRTTNPHQSFFAVAFKNYVPPDSTPPTAINDLSATAVSTNTISLSWTATGDDGMSGSILNGEYRLRYSTYSTVDWFSATGWDDPQNRYEIVWTTNVAPYDPQSLVITNLKEETTYYFCIWLKDDSGNWSLASNIASAKTLKTPDTTPPNAITDLAALVVGIGEVKLSWTATGDDGSTGDIFGGQYRIRYSSYTTSDPNFWTTGTWSDPQNKYEIVFSTDVLQGSQQTYVIKNLRGGVTYYFVIWLRDDENNWSTISNVAQVNIPLVAPAPITDLTAEGFFVGIKESEIRLNWTAVGENGFVGQATRYIIKVSSISNIENDTDFDNALDLTQLVSITIPTPKPAGSKEILLISGLVPGVTYYFAIKAENSDGLRGSWSRINANQQNFAVAFDEVPPDVSNLRAFASNREVTLTWEYNNKPKDFSFFRIYCDSTSATLWDDSFVIAETTNTILVISNLENNVLYYFKVTVVDQPPLVLESNGIVVSTTPYFAKPQPVKNFTATALSTTSILFSWENVSLNITKFKIYSATGGIIVEQELQEVQPQGSWLQTGLTPNTSSQVSYIIVSNEAGDSQPTYISSTVYTFANPPSEVQLVYISSDQYKLLFSSNSNPVYTLYAIYVSTDDLEYIKVKDIEDNFKITDLDNLIFTFEPDMNVYFKLWAYNKNGIKSEEVSYNIGTYDNIPPGKVSNLNLTLSEGQNEVIISWQSVGDNGSEKTFNGKYEIRYTYNPLYTWDLAEYKVVITTVAQPGDVLQTKISNLQYGATVYIYIRAYDDYNNPSEISQKFSIFIPAPQKFPKFVAGIKLTRFSETSIVLSWSEVTQNEDGTPADDIVGYKIYRSSKTIDTLVYVASTTANVLEFKDENLNPNIVYYYTVKSLNSKGVESKAVMFVDTQENVIFIPFNFEKTVEVKIPKEITKVFYKIQNGYPEDYIVYFSKINKEGYIASYEVKLAKYTNFEFSNINSFNKEFEITFYIRSYNIDKLSVYWWMNNKDIVRITSLTRTYSNNSITAKVLNTGLYSIAETKETTAETRLDKIYPTKIFTPQHNDPQYKEVKFYLSNPQQQEVVSFRIYDIRGSLIKDGVTVLQKDFVYSWDGKDDNGNFVPQGTYIYEIKLKNKTITGVIIVAK